MDDTHMTRLNIMLLAAAAGFLGAVALVLVASASAFGSSGDYTLTVDGVPYAPTKIVGSGPTVHYFTAGGTPHAASTERHTWTGHGNENLPCDGVLHWIDNANVLVISHCEQETGTTTTTTHVDTTTTSLPVVTTTTSTPTTTTTSTTIVSTTSTTRVGSTTTTTQDGATTTSTTTFTLCGEDGDAPCGGVQTGGGACDEAVEEGHPTCTLGSGIRWGWVQAGLALLILMCVVLAGALWRSDSLRRQGR